MASDRPKRENAGNRMTKLIEQQADEQEEDEFYKTTYGGFEEVEEDNDYEEEDDAEEDVVDSDFSASEQEDEAVGSDDEAKKPRRKKLIIKRRNTLPSGTVPRPKKPAVKRVIEPVLPADKRERMRASTMLKAATTKKQDSIKRHPRMPQMRRLTQEELLAEARITAEKNLASLAQFLKLEEEKKKNKFTKVRYQGPIVRFQSFRMPCVSEEIGQEVEQEFCTRNFLEFTDTQNFPKDYFPNVKHKRPEQSVCVVTGLPAKYKDPLTKLPYATIEAFKYIREHRRRIKEEMISTGTHLKRKRKRDSVAAI